MINSNAANSPVSESSNWSTESTSPRRCSMKAIGTGVLTLVLGRVVYCVAKKLLAEASRRSELKELDARLDRAVEDTMDCSDPITKY